MTAAVGLDRLPRPVALLLGEAAGNLLAVSNRLDELPARDGGPLIELGQAVDGGLDALEGVACCWHARPVDELAITLSSSGP